MVFSWNGILSMYSCDGGLGFNAKMNCRVSFFKRGILFRVRIQLLITRHI